MFFLVHDIEQSKATNPVSPGIRGVTPKLFDVISIKWFNPDLWIYIPIKFVS
jgi:hypothetical protein